MVSDDRLVEWLSSAGHIPLPSSASDLSHSPRDTSLLRPRSDSDISLRITNEDGDLATPAAPEYDSEDLTYGMDDVGQEQPMPVAYLSVPQKQRRKHKSPAPSNDVTATDYESDDETHFDDDVLTDVDDIPEAFGTYKSDGTNGIAAGAQENPFERMSWQTPAPAADLDTGHEQEYWKFKPYGKAERQSRGCAGCFLVAVFLIAMMANFISVLLQPGYTLGAFIRIMVSTDFIPSPIWYTVAISYIQFIMALVFTTKSIDAPKLYAILAYVSGTFGLIFIIAIWFLAFQGVLTNGAAGILTYSMVGVAVCLFLCITCHRQLSSFLSMGPLFSVLFLPLTTIILPFYVITNFADMTWGGRGSVSGAATVTNHEQLAVRLRLVTAFVVANTIVVAVVVFIDGNALIYITLSLVIVGYFPYVFGSIAYVIVRTIPFACSKRTLGQLLPTGPTAVRDLWIGITCYNEGEEEIQGTLQAIMGLPDTEELIGQHGYHVKCFILQDGRDTRTRDTYTYIVKYFMKHGARQSVTDQYRLKAPDVEIWECNPNPHITLYYLIKGKNRRKRDSQLLFFSLLFGVNKGVFGPAPQAFMMLDMDTTIKPQAVSRLYTRLLRDPTIGGVCGHVIVRKENCGFSQPLLMNQYFEFVVSHVVFKSAEDVVGYVTCLPGACTLFRTSCVEKVAASYSAVATRIVQKNCLDQGEDRYLTTLLALRGFKTAYQGNAEVSTSMFNDLEKYLEQRRRWQASTLANQIVVFKQMMRL